MDAVKVPVPSGCRGIDLDGRHYPAKGGYSVVTGQRATELKRIEDTLPVNRHSFSGCRLAEIQCVSCGKRKFAIMGPECKWCGGNCI